MVVQGYKETCMTEMHYKAKMLQPIRKKSYRFILNQSVYQPHKESVSYQSRRITAHMIYVFLIAGTW